MSHNTASIAPPPRPYLDEQRSLQEQLAGLHDKLDRLSLQLGHLYHRTLALEELKDELVRIARDAMAALTVELSAMEHEFNTEEIVHLLRKALRSTPRFIRLLETLESLDGLATELGPLSREVLRDFVERLERAERRGYFRLAQGGIALFDRVADHYSQEDIDRLSDNVVLILDTVKRMTQPEILALANNAIAVIDGGERKPPARLGFFGLVRALRDPEVQAGLGLSMEVLREIARGRSHDDSEFADPDQKGSRNTRQPRLLEGAKE